MRTKGESDLTDQANEKALHHKAVFADKSYQRLQSKIRVATRKKDFSHGTLINSVKRSNTWIGKNLVIVDNVF